MGRLNSEVMAVVKTFTIYRIAYSLVSRVLGVFGFLIFRKRTVRGTGDAADAQGGGPKGSLLDVRDFEAFAKQGGGGGGGVTAAGASGAGKVVGGVQIPGTAHPPHTPPSWRALLVVFLVTFVGLPVVVNRVFRLLSSRRTNAMELEWNKEGRGGQVVGVHDFAGESGRELSFRKGEVLTVINKLHPDWWEVANGGGHVGVVPASYVSNPDDMDTQPLHDELKYS